ncbi:MAG TPA: hypothetical protein VFS39_16045 [Nitrospira sp.]|nr:hypothetical protein [Nitrospira sp.]
MTPKEAADALVAALPTGLSVAQVEEYGIEATPEAAGAIVREVVSLNLFWICTAIDAQIPAQYRSLVKELVFRAAESRWAAGEGGAVDWASFLAEWNERKRRYDRLAQDGASPLQLNAEAGMELEEQGVITEDARRNVLTLLIDFVPVETYGHVLGELE